MTFPSGWGFYKTHLITGSAGAGTGYCVGIKCYKSDSGTDGTEAVNGVTMGKVYIPTAHVRDDFGDVRFTDAAGTLLDYWQDPDYLVSGTSSLFWVEVSADLGNNATIRIYYSNSSATSVSSGDATFLLYDHFDDTSLDPAKWAKDERGSGVVTEPSGTNCVLTVHPYGSIDSAGIQSVATFTHDIAILVKRKLLNSGDYGIEYATMTFGSGVYCDEDGNASGNYWLWTMKSSYYARYYNRFQLYNMPASGAGSIISDDYGTLTYNIYQILEMRYYSASGTLAVLLDGTSEDSAANTTFLNDAKKIFVRAGSYYSGNYGSSQHLDYVIVRKFIATEPGHSTWGSETAAAITHTRLVVEIMGGCDGSSEGIADSYPESNQSSNIPLLPGEEGVGQSFTTGSTSSKLTKAVFYLYKHSSPTGNAVAKLYAHQGTYGTDSKPSGSALATSDAVAASSLPGSPALVDFPFSGANQILLPPNTHFVITLEYYSGDSSNYIVAGIDNTTPTHAGNLCWITGGVWQPYSPEDLLFYVYGIPTLITKYTTHVRLAVDILGGVDSLMFTIGGITRNAAGAVLAGCTVILLRTSDNAYIASTVSDAAGRFSFIVTDKTVTYYLVAFLAGSPNVQGATYNDITAGKT